MLKYYRGSLLFTLFALVGATYIGYAAAATLVVGNACKC